MTERKPFILTPRGEFVAAAWEAARKNDFGRFVELVTTYEILIAGGPEKDAAEEADAG